MHKSHCLNEIVREISGSKRVKVFEKYEDMRDYMKTNNDLDVVIWKAKSFLNNIERDVMKLSYPLENGLGVRSLCEVAVERNGIRVPGDIPSREPFKKFGVVFVPNEYKEEYNNYLATDKKSYIEVDKGGLGGLSFNW